ncbi:AAA family ATPase [Microbacterium sp. I2]|uniref:AAA family ATPase n=1 Tax=Microbacterium sp. I2 TaxID=3391826 RepID=UPI003EDB57EB
MGHILITGMSGVGKSSVLSELSRRGHRTIDTDYGPWVGADGAWDEPRMAALLSAASPVVVSGAVENQGRFYNRFAAVVLLSAPLDVLLRRLSTRTNNPYGKSERDQAEVRRYARDIEPLLRRGATLELDARRPVSELADEVEKLIEPPDSKDAVTDRHGVE